ncbi:MAG: hypothetical protein KDD11_15715 [Acidobacteria bacterium]|nr:hypothetical protein [Acidobacteriota bacterium]
MISTLILASITAILSAALTLGIGFAIVQRRWERERQVLEDRLEARLAKAGDELGAIIEERVRKGVLDAVARIPTAEVLSGTTRSAAQAGADLVGYGLSALLGRGGKKPSGDT